MTTEPKVWFITGAGSGIGAGAATAAIRAGHRVVATGRNMEKLRSAFGRIDVLVNNAGYSLLGNFEEMTIDQLERQFAPNFWGAVAAAWSPYNGKQPNDPAKLGEALVQIANMESPPKVFAAGSDALETIVPAVEARLHDLRAHDALSRSAGGF